MVAQDLREGAGLAYGLREGPVVARDLRESAGSAHGLWEGAAAA